MLEILSMVLGPVMTNTYLVGDSETGQAVAIDPADSGEIIVREAQARRWQIEQIWLTHAHFDHLAGVSGIINNASHSPVIALHPDDKPLWRMGGGAALFGMDIDPGPEPEVDLKHGQKLKVGQMTFEVRHTPGHTPGHVVFYCSAEQLVFSGDVIFQNSIGRTDLPGGDYATLIASIRDQILSLPDETRLLSGHGPETTVGVERRMNPFIS
jgi:glyoxylase-like metal-dependent hydrolase (beta-lactamase superfamily II)